MPRNSSTRALPARPTRSRLRSTSTQKKNLPFNLVRVVRTSVRSTHRSAQARAEAISTTRSLASSHEGIRQGNVAVLAAQTIIPERCPRLLIVCIFAPIASRPRSRRISRGLHHGIVIPQGLSHSPDYDIAERITTSLLCARRRAGRFCRGISHCAFDEQRLRHALAVDKLRGDPCLSVAQKTTRRRTRHFELMHAVTRRAVASNGFNAPGRLRAEQVFMRPSVVPKNDSRTFVRRCIRRR